MDINRTAVWPQLKATAIQVGRHGSAAGQAAMRIPSADTGSERAIAAARSIDELDHAIENARSTPGISLVPLVASAAAGYEMARAILRGAAGSGFAARAHPTLAAAELLASRDHMVEGAALHHPGASEVDRQRATSLLDAALSDADSGFAFLGHPPQEGLVRGALASAKLSVQLREPIDQSSIMEAARILETSAGSAAHGSPAAPAAPATGVAPATINAEAPLPTPIAVARSYASSGGPMAPAPASASRYPQVRLDLPRLVLPPIPTFSR